jgi:alkylation response protein AidB-like acyl-CoA dehydrogenase
MKALRRSHSRIGGLARQAFARSAPFSALASARIQEAGQLRGAAEAAAAAETPGVLPPLCALTEDEEMLQQHVRKFAAAEVAPRVRSMEAQGMIDPALVTGLFEQGLMGVDVPMELGGAGQTFLSSCLAVEELAKADPSVAVMMDVHNTLITTIVKTYASASLQEEFLPRLCTNTVGSFCLSEAGSGSDAFALACRAVEDGDDYLLTGTKMWVTSAQEAGVYLVFATVNPALKHRGITCFLVERDQPGLVVGKEEKKMGLKASRTCALHLDSVRVPKSRVVGEVGTGYKIAINALNEGRIGIGAQLVGMSIGAFESVMPYLHERKQFGQPLADFQGMRLQYAQAWTEISAARLLVYEAARKKCAGLPFVQDAAMAKLFASQVCVRTTSNCVQWLGGVGFTEDYLAEKFYRDCIVGTIYEGTSNMNLETIGKILQQEYS